MHGVVDSVKAFFLCSLRKLELALGSAILGVNAHLEVLLGGVGQDFAEELRELSGVLRRPSERRLFLLRELAAGDFSRKDTPYDA